MERVTTASPPTRRLQRGLSEAMWAAPRPWWPTVAVAVGLVAWSVLTETPSQRPDLTVTFYGLFLVLAWGVVANYALVAGDLPAQRRRAILQWDCAGTLLVTIVVAAAMVWRGQHDAAVGGPLAGAAVAALVYPSALKLDGAVSDRARPRNRLRIILGGGFAALLFVASLGWIASAEPSNISVLVFPVLCLGVVLEEIRRPRVSARETVQSQY